MSYPRLRHTLLAAAIPMSLGAPLLATSALVAPSAIAQDQPQTAADHVKKHLDTLSKARMSRARKKDVEALQTFYEGREHKHFWHADDGKLHPRAKQFFAVLEKIDLHGLDPASFGMPKIADQDPAKSDQERAKRDVYLTLLLVRYAGDLHAGNVKPSRTAPNNYRKPVRPETLILLTTAGEAEDFGKFLASLEPKARRYRRLKKALAKYRALAENGGWSKIEAGKTLKPGMTHKRVEQVKKRLMVTGELTALGDNPEEYDDALVAAVKKFQTRHGLTPDGKIGRNTLTQMNVPLEFRIQQIIINMERRRWLDPDLGKKYVFVNIADYELKYVESDKTKYVARVVVGRTYHKTPIFSDRIRYVRFNPYWNVPYSIASREMLPKIKKDPGYLARNRYMLLTRPLDNSSAINPHSVDWSKYSRRNFPYYIRQKSGRGNALGTMIFMFPNRHNVFIHDTQARSLFSREVRSFSHGCIRLEKPHELAGILLASNDGWTPKRIRDMAKKDKEVQVPLKQHIPVHITYLTAWADIDGTVNFRRDIYKRDRALIKILARPTKSKKK